MPHSFQDYTKKGVQIPLPDGIDLVEDVVEYHDVSYDKSRAFNLTPSADLTTRYPSCDLSGLHHCRSQSPFPEWFEGAD